MLTARLRPNSRRFGCDRTGSDVDCRTERKYRHNRWRSRHKPCWKVTEGWGGIDRIGRFTQALRTNPDKIGGLLSTRTLQLAAASLTIQQTLPGGFGENICRFYCSGASVDGPEGENDEPRHIWIYRLQANSRGL